MRGCFVTLEGIEGVGKTSNLTFINDLLKDAGISVLVTREPGGTDIAESIREILLSHHTEELHPSAELLLVFASRVQHIYNVIQPALDKGIWVLCDRFTDATYAYQGGGRKIALDHIAWLENFVQGDLRPDLTILLDAPVEIGLSRAKKRSQEDRFEKETSEFFHRVRQGYLNQAKLYPDRYQKIDAEQPLQSVQEEIRSIIVPYLKNFTDENLTEQQSD